MVKFSVSQSELQNALSVVSKGISNRSTLPVLSGILISASNQGLEFQSTDLVLSIKYHCNALVEEEGKTVVPAKFFLDVVKNLNDSAVTMEVRGETAEIYCDSSSLTLKTLNPDDFPSFPQIQPEQAITLPFKNFQSMVKRVARVVSHDESRAILTGALITVENNVLKMVATDSYRLAITQTDATNVNDFSAVISGSFLLDIASLNKNEETIQIGIAENQVIISFDQTVFINRRIEGNYPNYKQLLPESSPTKVKINTAALQAAVKRASLLGTTASPVKFVINPQEQTVKLSASSQDIGSVEEEITCEGTGELVEVAFNCAYLLDGLSVVSTENIFLEVQSSLKPGIITSDKEESFLYLVMPVRIS